MTVLRTGALRHRIGFISAAILLGTTAVAQAQTQLEIIFPTPPTTFAIPHYVAMDRGCYDKEGLAVKDTHLIGDANAFRALVSGQGDMVLVGPSTTMNGILKGANVKAFFSWQPRVDYQLITAKGQSDKIDQGLVGLKFASGGGISMLNHMTAMILEKHGLDSSKMEHVPIGGHSDRLAAVIAGKAQMSLVNTLTATRAGDQINVVTPVAKELGGIGYVYLVARQDTLASNERREALKKFVKCSMMGARDAIKDPKFASAALHKRAPETELALIEKVVMRLNEVPVWGVNGGIDPEITNFTAGAYQKYKVIPKPISIDQVLEPSIVDSVVQEIGRM